MIIHPVSTDIIATLAAAFVALNADQCRKGVMDGILGVAMA